LENINPSNLEESNHHSSNESQKTSFRTIQLLTDILNEYPSKHYEKMAGARLNWYLETQILVSPAQSDFRRYCSTNQQIVMLSQEIKDSLDRKGILLTVFVDFKSAYDSVWRVNLMDKLQKNWCKG
jgi:hypothetical protein